MDWLPSEAYQIWQRLISRFELKRGAAMPDCKLSTIVVPTTNADELLGDVKIASSTQDISAGSGITIFHTVPDGKRWKLIAYHKGATTASTNVLFYDETGSVNFPTLGGTAAVVEYFGAHTPVLEQKWTLRMANTGNGADTARSVYLWYIEENSSI